MVFLQEAIAAGPFLLIAVGIALAFVLAGCVAIYNIMKRPQKKGSENNNHEQVDQESKRNNNFVLYIIIFICFGLALVMFNWLCNLKFD